MTDTEDVERALKTAWNEWVRDIREQGAVAAAALEPPGPGVRCHGCGALPDEQCGEECPERDPGPIWPGVAGNGDV